MKEKILKGIAEYFQVSEGEITLGEFLGVESTVDFKVGGTVYWCKVNSRGMVRNSIRKANY